MDYQIPEVYVFPLDTPNQKIMDLKQFMAAKKSIDMLEVQIRENEYKGGGMERLLRQRQTECREIVAKIVEKYRTV